MIIEEEQQKSGVANSGVDVGASEATEETQMFTSSGNNNNEGERLTPVAQLFNGRSVFITGASGFIGRVLLEKLLRSYQGIKRIYILLRPKKNLQPHDRLHKQLLKVPIFDHIRSMKNGQQLLDKIVVLSGDIGDEGLGLSEEDRQKLLQDPTLAVVFHSAASVKFDEPLKASVRFNLLATKVMIQLCKQMKHLRCLCHVSTAYVNSDLREGQEIEEKLYPMSQDPEKVIKLAELMDEDLMQQVKPVLVGKRPNTYTYTKSLAEHLIALEASDLPVAIVRPSIVVASWKEPLRGWVDNLNGPTGLILAIGKGLLRTMYVDRACKADLIPVDIVANTMIAAANYVAEKHSGRPVPPLASIGAATSGHSSALANGKHQTNENAQENINKLEGATKSDTRAARQPPIFHCTSGDVNPITWGKMEDLFWPIILKYPSQQVLRYPYGTFKPYRYYDLITRLFVHYLPALIIDLLCLVMGKKRQMLMIYNKLHKATSVLANFCTTDYNFKSNNIKTLQASLIDPLDRKQLFMDISALDWYSFWDDYVLGARRYVLKEEDYTLPESRESFRRARHLEWAFRAILTLMAMAIFYPLVGSSMKHFAAASYETLMNVA